MSQTFLIFALLFLACGQLRATETLPACTDQLPALADPKKALAVLHEVRTTREALRQQYFAKGGLLASKGYAWTVREQFRKSNGGSVEFNDDAFRTYPMRSAKHILSRLEETFPISFLEKNLTGEAARSAVREMELRKKETGLTDRQYFSTAQKLAEATRTPETREALLGYMAETLPLHGPSLVRGKLAGPSGNVAKDVLSESALYAFPPILGIAAIPVAAATSFALGSPFLATVGIGGAIGAALVPALLAGTGASWFVYAKAKALYYKLALRNSLKEKPYDQTFARQLTVDAKKQTPAKPLALSSKVESLPPLVPYQANAETIKQIASDPAKLPVGKRDSFGDEVQSRLSFVAQQLFERQRYAKTRYLWERVDATVTALLAKGKTRDGLTPGEASARLHEPIEEIMTAFEPVIADLRALQEDAFALKAKLHESEQAGSRYQTDAMTKFENSELDPAAARSEGRRLLSFDDRLKTLREASTTADFLLLSIDQTEELVSNSKTTLQNLRQSLLNVAMLPAPRSKKADPVLQQLKTLKTHIDQLPKR